jgi:hypothetical protein
MRRFIWASTYVAGGLAAGCLSAFLMIQHAGRAPVSEAGAWQTRPPALSGTAAFYARAHYLLAGRLPPAPGHILEATAETDDQGQPLSAGCTYRLTAQEPLPGWWSLAAVAAGALDGSLQAAATSSSVMRAADGSLSLMASRLPASGNWLKLPERRRLILLYTALSPEPAVTAPPFAITREGCP